MLNSISVAHQNNNMNFGMARVDKAGRRILREIGVDAISTQGYYDAYFKKGNDLARLLVDGQNVDKFLNVIQECGLNSVIPPSLRAEFTQNQVINNLSTIKKMIEPHRRMVATKKLGAILLNLKEKFAPTPKLLSREDRIRVRRALAHLYMKDSASNPYLSKYDTKKFFKAVESYYDTGDRNALGCILGLHSK